MVKEIPLQNGMVALVDDEDFDKAKEYTWYFQSGNESVRTMVNRKIFYLGRLIMNCQNSKKRIYQIQKGLDYRKNNLAILEDRKSSRMMRSRKGSSSKYKGVSWDKRQNKWVANIRVNGKLIYLGRFLNEDDAAKAYNKASLKYFGETAYRNKIGTSNYKVELDCEKSEQKRSKNQTGYRGIWFDGFSYYSKIIYQKEKIRLGKFDTPEKAAKAYDKKAYELHGDKAILNFPELIEKYKVMQ